MLVAALPKGNGAFFPRICSVLATLAVLSASLAVFFRCGVYSPNLPGIIVPWIPSLGVNLSLSVDELNIYPFMLTALLFPAALICCWKRHETGSRLFLSMFLLLESTLMGTFLSQNLAVFFMFWEAVLIPMFVIILVFGGKKRNSAAFTFFIYTMAGSILFLAAVIALGVESLKHTGAWSFELTTLAGLSLDWNTQLFIFLAIILACAIKCPLFPFHSWLPQAYCETPFAASALMAGVLSKMGVFGILKLAIPLCPDAAKAFGSTMMAAAVFSLIYGAVIALRQADYKKLVAYSSLSHMGYIVLGIFSFNEIALHGAMLQILSHGVTVAGFFLVFGLLEQRLGSDYLKLTALSDRAPRLAFILMLFILSSLALPLTSGFTSEFLILFGSFQSSLATWKANNGTVALIAVLAASTSVILGAAYMLRFARKILYGKAELGSNFPDLGLREAIALAPLLSVILWIGVNPNSIIKIAEHATGAAELRPQPAVYSLNSLSDLAKKPWRNQ